MVVLVVKLFDGAVLLPTESEAAEIDPVPVMVEAMVAFAALFSVIAPDNVRTAGLLTVSVEPVTVNVRAAPLALPVNVRFVAPPMLMLLKSPDAIDGAAPVNVSVPVKVVVPPACDQTLPVPVIVIVFPLSTSVPAVWLKVANEMAVAAVSVVVPLEPYVSAPEITHAALPVEVAEPPKVRFVIVVMPVMVLAPLPLSPRLMYELL